MTSGERLRVTVVADASPAKGGLATFAETVVHDDVLQEGFDIGLLNTTRRAIWKGGAVNPRNVLRGLADAFRTWRAARRSHVVHIHTALLPFPPLVRALALCAASRLGRAAVLCHVHTGLVNRGPFESFAPGKPTRWFLRALSVTHALIAVSDAGAAGLKGVAPSARIERIDNAVDVSSFSVSSPAEGVPVVLYAGALGRNKGLLDLLEAAILLRSRGLSDWRLQVIGGANQLGAREADRIRQAYRRAGIGDVLVGELPVADVRARMVASAIFVLPSTSEGQPISVLEAMACALPVIGTGVGGIPEAVRDGVDGIIVDPGDVGALADAIERLVTSPELRRDMGVAARRRAEERYDLPRLRERLGDLYREVARDRRSHRRTR